MWAVGFGILKLRERGRGILGIVVGNVVMMLGS